MANLDLVHVDEIIEMRHQMHGGRRGAPYVRVDGSREGQALNRAALSMLSANLQAYCEEVFFETSVRVLGLEADAEADYRDLYSRWGNPSSSNIINHFRRVGVPNAIATLSWRNCNSETVKSKLDDLNQLRNGVAHGQDRLRIRGDEISLSLAMVNNYRNFAEQFGERFEAHIAGIV